VQSTAHCHGLVSWYRRWMNKFTKMKVHWWTYKQCLFVSYLTSVTFGYGWISDTKFQKFSDEDWIWIFKFFFGYGSGVKKSISAHLWYCASVHGMPKWNSKCQRPTSGECVLWLGISEPGKNIRFWAILGFFSKIAFFGI